MSLGLEEAGFTPIYVNEISPDAMATYLRNRVDRFPHLNEDWRRSNDIFDVTRDGDTLANLASSIRRDEGNVDLVVGGPPCQGYSGIGHRRTFTELAKADMPSNHLYREMATFIDAVKPRAFVFENVRGLLSARWTWDGPKGELWEDVRTALEGIEGYETRWSLVQAKWFGVPQNRPRILLVGVRRDLGWRPVAGKLADGLLPEPFFGAPDPVDFLGDLVDPSYLESGATAVYPAEARGEWQEWFRTDLDGRIAGKGDPITEHEYSHHSERVVRRFKHMLEHSGEIRPEDQTKKFAQRVVPARWGDNGPTITATSLADDYVHFCQPRSLTVREWARMQTFPDWYQFSGKRTTGGRRRAGDPDKGDWSREVPKYTQIGNAVPVWMARAVGRHLVNVLDLGSKPTRAKVRRSAA